MNQESGVFTVPIEVNEVPMKFIFDTGASSISISQVEASFLYKQGKLTEEDVRGSQQFQDANGDVSIGIIINLKTVKIGDRVLANVPASVVTNNSAPLLLGQSALQRFGKFTIDYQEGTITL